MQFRFSILASGSSGNAMIIENKEVRLLVDAGLSAKKLEALMQERETTCKNLDGILVTHEHADHIQGLGALSRRYKIPVFANEKTWLGMENKIGVLEDRQRNVFRTRGCAGFRPYAGKIL